MTGRSTLMVCLIVAGCFGLPSRGSAVESTGEDSAQVAANGLSPTGQTSADVQDLLDDLAERQAPGFLQLNAQQRAAFGPRMGVLQAVRRQHLRARTASLQNLRRTLQAPTDADAVRAVEALDALDARIAQEDRAAVLAVDEQLTPLQRLRFRLFEDRMEQQKLELLLQARGGRK